MRIIYTIMLQNYCKYYNIALLMRNHINMRGFCAGSLLGVNDQAKM